MAEQNNITQDKSQKKTIRLVRPSVVVLCGPAACGKSTFAARYFRPTQIISSDHARALVSDDERDQRFQAQAFSLVHTLIDLRLGINRLCVVDSTALTPQSRASLLEIARKHRVPCVALVFDVPLEKCLERDANRERTVGRPVIEKQYQLFEQTRAAIKQEGFSEVIELREEDLAAVDIEIRFRPVQTAAESNRPSWRSGPARSAQTDASGGARPREARRGSQPSLNMGQGGEAPRREKSAASPAPAQTGSTPAPPGGRVSDAAQPAAPAAMADSSAKAAGTTPSQTSPQGQTQEGT
ncbi:MAG TPA: AAA family ATPase [Terriglobia bacterium]|nr:AAA family ATPase [Terriglobia bacterium]